jgi:hypothetical protein
MLTVAERKAAVERAMNYPPGMGAFYVAVALTEDDDAQMTDIGRSCPYTLREVKGAAIWLQMHPKDVEKG